MSRRSKYTIAISKYDLPDRKKSTLSKFFRIPRTLIDQVYSKGIGAFKTAGARPNVTSKEQWATARTYRFIINVIKAREGKTVPTGRGSDYTIVEQAVAFSDYVPTTKK